MITVKAPGKIIISGEHAVVYKNPALAMAVNIFATTTIKKNPEKKIALNLINLKYKCDFVFHQLAKRVKIIQDRYSAFLAGKISIKNVLCHPTELIIYTIGTFISFFSIDLQEGLIIEIDSQILGGYGLGSSAAVIVSILKALLVFFDIKSDEINLWNLGRSIENAQHGISSGLDVYLAIHREAVYFAEGQFFPRKIPEVPMFFVNTGKPESSTGVCVSQVATKVNNEAILKRFGEVTKSLDSALYNNDIVLIKKYISENHKLLCEIGVVPAKVANFISKIEARGLAAKVSGAGSVSGNNAGIVLVIGTEEDVSDIIHDFCYKILIINGERNV